MRAVILAAGQGARLRPLTDDRPKCLVSCRGRAILDHGIESLRAGGVDEVAIVTGYRADTIRPYGLMERHNPDYDRTNMVASLFCAEDLMPGGFLIVYGDILFSPRHVRSLLTDPAPVALAINTRWRELWEMRMEDPLEDAETLKLDRDGNIVELGRKPTSYDDIQGQYTGLIRVAAEGVASFRDFHRSLDRAALYEGRSYDQMFLTAFLQAYINAGNKVKAVKVEGSWAEVDSIEDLQAVERLPENFFR